MLSGYTFDSEVQIPCPKWSLSERSNFSCTRMDLNVHKLLGFDADVHSSMVPNVM